MRRQTHSYYGYLQTAKGGREAVCLSVWLSMPAAGTQQHCSLAAGSVHPSCRRATARVVQRSTRPTWAAGRRASIPRRSIHTHSTECDAVDKLIACKGRGLGGLEAEVARSRQLLRITVVHVFYEYYVLLISGTTRTTKYVLLCGGAVSKFGYIIFR